MARRRLSLDEDTGEDPSEVVIPSSPRTVLNKDLIEDFCKLVRRGLPFDGVCDHLGLAYSTFWTWQRKGKQWVEGNGEPKRNAIYGQFVLALRRALAEYRLERVDALHAKGNNYWVRDATVLERRDRKNFARMDPAGGADEEYDPNEKFL